MHRLRPRSWGGPTQQPRTHLDRRVSGKQEIGHKVVVRDPSATKAGGGKRLYTLAKLVLRYPPLLRAGRIARFTPKKFPLPITERQKGASRTSCQDCADARSSLVAETKCRCLQRPLPATPSHNSNQLPLEHRNGSRRSGIRHRKKKKKNVHLLGRLHEVASSHHCERAVGDKKQADSGGITGVVTTV
ncbi:hypothetical protein GQ53DRAFT_123465 [Thozetella sp. PMI_491]|nr:hypothetical protein GQ53DRAFT_123465 [Thozetella sp. PMI_491]